MRLQTSIARGIISSALGAVYNRFKVKPRRTLNVIRMRFTDFEPRIPHELAISSKGIALTGTRII